MLWSNLILCGKSYVNKQMICPRKRANYVTYYEFNRTSGDVQDDIDSLDDEGLSLLHYASLFNWYADRIF